MKLRHTAVAAALLGLAGCSSSGSAAQEVSSTSTPTTSASTDGGLLPDQAYLDMVRDGTRWWDGVPDDKLLANSKLVCEVLEEALTDDQFFKAYLGLLKSSLDNGMEAREAGAYFTYAASQYCTPQVTRINNLPGA